MSIEKKQQLPKSIIMSFKIFLSDLSYKRWTNHIRISTTESKTINVILKRKVVGKLSQFGNNRKIKKGKI